MACDPELQKKVDKLQEIKDVWFDRDTQVGENIYKVVGDDPGFFKSFMRQKFNLIFIMESYLL